MATLGTFDDTQVPEGWFDETAQASGWFDGDSLDAQADAEASNDRGITAAFQTRAVRSRRHQQAIWVAGLAPTQQAVVVPVSSWLSRPVERRQSLKRRIQLLPAFQWKYIAPTIPASTDRPKIKVIRFDRKIKLPLPAVLYPPSIGPPPVAAWALVKARTVSQRRRLLAQASQPSYPAIPTTPSADRSLEPGFVTTRIRSKKALRAPDAPVFPQTAAPTAPYVAVSKAIRRKETKRRLIKASAAPVKPLAAVTDSGGGGWEPFHFYAIRRREMLREANQRKQEAIEEAKDDAVQKEIARRLHAELASQDERAQLERLRALVEEHENLTNSSQRLETAFLKAKSERTFSRLQALQRELIKAQEEEEMAVLMILLADD